MSLERLRNADPYQGDNFVFIICRMNTSDWTAHANETSVVSGNPQWTEEKWIEFHRGYNPNYCPERQARFEELFRKAADHPSGTRVNTRQDVDFRTCTRCYKKFPIAELVRSNSTSCHACYVVYQMVHRAKQKDAAKGFACDMTEDIIKRKVLDQNGLCGISRHELTVAKLSHFQMSLERRNELLGHTDANTYLICLEFQTGDKSRNAGVDPDDVVERTQWTPEIFMDIFWPDGVLEDPTTWKYRRV